MSLHQFFFLYLTTCISIHAAAAGYLQGRLKTAYRLPALSDGLIIEAV